MVKKPVVVLKFHKELVMDMESDNIQLVPVGLQRVMVAMLEEAVARLKIILNLKKC